MKKFKNVMVIGAVCLVTVLGFQNCGSVTAFQGESRSSLENSQSEKVVFSENFDDGTQMNPVIDPAQAFIREDRYTSTYGDFLILLHGACAPCSHDAGPGGFALSQSGGVNGSRALELRKAHLLSSSFGSLELTKAVKIDPTKRYQFRIDVLAIKTYLIGGHEPRLDVNVGVHTFDSNGDEAFPQTRKLDLKPSTNWNTYSVVIEPDPSYANRSYEMFFDLSAQSNQWSIFVDNIVVEEI